MTAIAALKYEGGVAIGGDAAGVAGYRLTQRQDPKVFHVGRLLVGYTSSFRMAQLIRFGWEDCLKIEDLRPPTDPKDGFEFMVRDFIPRVRWIWKQGGFLGSSSHDDGRDSGGAFLVAWDEQLYQVEEDLQVGIPACPFDAVGCGVDLVKGALDAMSSNDAEKKISRATASVRIQRSLEIAERHSAGVRGPMTVLNTEGRP